MLRGLTATTLNIFVVFWAPQMLASELGRGDSDLRVMTYNVDEGTDYIEVIAAINLSQFLVAVGQTISQVRATDPPSRMNAIAAQIIDARPALVSLQELDQWFTAVFDPGTQTCGPVAKEFDMLQELLSSLAVQGANYEVAVQARQFAFPPTPGLILPSTFLCVQVINHNAILVRTDLDPSLFQWSNAQSGQFTSALFIYHYPGRTSYGAASLGVGGCQFPRKGISIYRHSCRIS